MQLTMARWILLLYSLKIVFAQSEVHGIAEKILQTTHFVLPASNSVTIIHQAKISDTLEAILVRFLQLSSTPVTININSAPVETTSFILFVDTLDSIVRQVLHSEHRKVLVTSEDRFAALLEECISKERSNTVILVQNGSIYHYNHFRGQLSTWSDLQTDVITEATNDLAGLSFNSVFVRTSDSNLVEIIAQKLNGSNTPEKNSNINILYINSLNIKQYMRAYKVFYMHRTDFNYVIVPRLNKAVPAVYILTDPFALDLWLLNLAAIFVLAVFRTYLTKRRTVHSLVQFLANLVAAFTSGQVLRPFRRELERQLVGLYLLLYMVLFNCYQSLIISYLLTPRFYPELDTLQQLNESCCWGTIAEIAEFNFQRYGECSMIGIPDSENIREARSMSLCLAVDTWMRDTMEFFDWKTTFEWELFRWSKVTLNEWPMLGLIAGDRIVADRVESISRVYYAEGALGRRFEKEAREIERIHDPKSFTLIDLSLVWLIYLVGMVSGGIALIVEVCIGNVPKMTRRMIRRLNKK